LKFSLKGLFGFAVFLTVFAILFELHRSIAWLDNWMGIAFLARYVVVGGYALLSSYASAERESRPAAMPSLVGALPPSWRKWVLGQSDDPPAR
jgi:hypothetical protein